MARIVLGLLRAAAAASALALAPAAAGFGFEDVAARARALAAAPYTEPPKAADPRLLSLGYDAWRGITFRPSRAIWHRAGLGFELQLFHVGAIHPHPVKLHEIVGGAERALALPRDGFDFGRVFEDAPPPAPEVAGVRIHSPLGHSDHADEVIAFLGASYFRAPGPGQYGTSARGVAIDTVGGEREEFPNFEAFWFERPKPGATALTLYALLNGPRIAGAYRFVVKPGAPRRPTVVDVRARLYLRAPVATLGLAPLTSMFLSGENQPRPRDFRPEVHDADGLLLAGGDGGEWIWRPLINPPEIVTARFAQRSPRGFGLMQRDRSFASYQDSEARYERRPSVWVEPLGDWGAGRVELMQFPTDYEFTDNAVAYWVPDTTPPPGRPIDIAWRLHWQGDAMREPPLGRAVQSRRGQGPVELAPDQEQMVVDFAGGRLARLPAGAAVEPALHVDGAELLHAQAFRNRASGGWRMVVKLKRLDRERTVGLRATLQWRGEALTEIVDLALPP